MLGRGDHEITTCNLSSCYQTREIVMQDHNIRDQGQWGEVRAFITFIDSTSVSIVHYAFGRDLKEMEAF